MFVSCFILLLATGFGLAVEEVKDGKFYQITSALDNQDLTVTSGDMAAGNNISVQAWKDQPTQKFLAVFSSKQGGTDSFLLVPKKQKFDWEKFVGKESRSLKNRYDDLTGSTLVLGVESIAGKKEVAQQVKNDKPTQFWQFNQIGSTGKVLIRNLETDLCLRNPGAPAKKTGFLNMMKSATKGAMNAAGVRQPSSKLLVVTITGCNRDEENQQWIVESHSA